jgi:hypothetical protein
LNIEHRTPNAGADCHPGAVEGKFDVISALGTGVAGCQLRVHWQEAIQNHPSKKTSGKYCDGG